MMTGRNRADDDWQQGRRQEFFQGGSKGYILDHPGGSETIFLRIYMVKIKKIAEPGGQPSPPADAPDWQEESR